MRSIRYAFLGIFLPLLPLYGGMPPNVVVTPNFIVDAPDAETAKAAGDLAEKARDKFAKRMLGRDLERWNIPVLVVVSQGQEVTNGKEQILGRRLNLIEIWGKTNRDAISVLEHEVAHSVLDREVARYQPIPRWFHEGVAVTFEVVAGKWPDRYGPVVGRMPLRNLVHAEGIPFNINGNAFYNQSASLVMFVRDHWGMSRVYELYHNARLYGWELSVPVTLGVSFDDFEKMWFHSIDSPSNYFPKK